MRSRLFMAVICTCFFGFFFLLPFSPSSLADSKAPANTQESSPTETDPVLARIDERVIRLSEFEVIFRAAVRNKFYHGTVPEQELKEFQQKVAKDIVDQVLLQRQAKKLNIEPDLPSIKEGLARYDQRYSMNPNWQPRSEEATALLIERLSQKNIIEQVEARTKDIPKPTQKKVHEYYLANPDKFTEPKRLHVSVILLPVPPSSLSDAWQEAEQVAQMLITRVKNGEKFADLAKEYSAHASSVNGGDLGYLHQDMLEPNAQQAVDNIKIKEMTVPVRVLRGYTIFQLNDIREPRLNDFETVKERAGNLLYRDMQDETWKNFIAALREEADIYVNEELLGSKQ